MEGYYIKKKLINSVEDMSFGLRTLNKTMGDAPQKEICATNTANVFKQNNNGKTTYYQG